MHFIFLVALMNSVSVVLSLAFPLPYLSAGHNPSPFQPGWALRTGNQPWEGRGCTDKVSEQKQLFLCSTHPPRPRPFPALLLRFFSWPRLGLQGCGTSALSGSMTCQPFAESEPHQSRAD